MDPLSIAASVVSVAQGITTLVQGVQWISSVRNAPAEFLDLQNELETIRGYLEVLRTTIDGLIASSVSKLAPSVWMHIEETLDALHDEVQSLQDLADSFAAQGKDSVRKLKWRWKKEKIMFHRDKIRHRRLELSQAVNLLQPVQSQSHSVLLLDVHEDSRVGFATIGKMIEASTERIQSSIENISSPKTPTETTTTNLWTKPAKQTETVVKDPEKQRAHHVFHAFATLRKACPMACPCQCHTFRQVQSSGPLSKVIGSFFVAYSGIPVWDPRPCNHSRCRNARSDSVQLHYVFPSWLVRKAVSFSASWGGFTGPGASLHLHVARVIPDSHDVWATLDRDDVTRLQAMITLREVFPTDVDSQGVTLFHHALTDPNSEKTQEFLLGLSVDVHATNINGRSPWGIARRAYCGRLVRSEKGEYIARKVLELGGEEDDESTPIHEAVHTPRKEEPSLAEAIRANPRSINVQDGIGFAPLHWAAYRDDVEAARQLLAFGADMDARDRAGNTAFFYAVGMISVRVAALLIESGCEVNTVSKHGITPLMAALNNDVLPADLVAALLSHGANPNHRTTSGHLTLLYLNTTFENPEVVKSSERKLDLLIEAGVDLEQPNGDGKTTLLIAAQYDDAGYIRALLRRGASVEAVDDLGLGLLHYVAIYATERIMCELDGWCGSLDPDRRSKEGFTAEEYFQRRTKPPAKGEVSSAVPASEKVVAAWERLIRGVREAEVDDVFVDAVEDIV